MSYEWESGRVGEWVKGVNGRHFGFSAGGEWENGMKNLYKCACMEVFYYVMEVFVPTLEV